MTARHSFFAVFLIFLGTLPLCAQFSQWRGLSSNWNDPNNWTNGIPTSSLDARISIGSEVYFDPYVPAPLGIDTAKNKNLQTQSGGNLYFGDGGVLVVYGTDKLQNDGSVFLGNGKMIFKNSITFLQGGTFDAGSGTLDFQGVTWDNKNGSTFIPGTSSIVLNGSSPQTIQGNLAFYDIEIASTSGSVMLSGNFTVTNSLVIDPGISVTLSSGSLTLASTATLDIGEGSTLTIQGTFNNFGTVTGPGRVILEPALPVQLTSFTATRQDFTVRLAWSTQTETNNYGFEIERRAVSNQPSAVSWQKVDFVAGSGTSSSPRTYGYIDANLPSNRYAYRIKQIDNDGTSQYYGHAEVEVGLASREFKLESNYPNPFNPTTTIQFTLADDGRATLKVYNMIGQEVATLFDAEGQAGRIQQVKFDASRLPSGLYFAKLEAGKQQMLRKMMLVK